MLLRQCVVGRVAHWHGKRSVRWCSVRWLVYRVDVFHGRVRSAVGAFVIICGHDGVAGLLYRWPFGMVFAPVGLRWRCIWVLLCTLHAYLSCLLHSLPFAHACTLCVRGHCGIASAGQLVWFRDVVVLGGIMFAPFLGGEVIVRYVVGPRVKVCRNGSPLARPPGCPCKGR